MKHEFWEWLWLTLLPLFGWAWKLRRDDLTDMRAALAKKADKEDLQRHEDNLTRLYDKQDQLQKDMGRGFSEVMAAVHSGQMAIMQELAKKADK